MPEDDIYDDTYIEAVVAHAAHLLPMQGPISIFIHHNTLHAFEDLPFTEAVVKAGQILNCEPFLSEDRYREELRSGRISEGDLRAVLAEDIGEHDRVLMGRISRLDVRLAMLRYGLREERRAALDWLLAETDVLVRLRKDIPHESRNRILAAHGSAASSSEAHEQATVRALWEACVAVTAALPAPPEPPAPERVRGSSGDPLVHPLLIRLCAAFLDQGIAYWPLPQREAGFYVSFRRLYASGIGPQEPWAAGLPARLREEEAAGFSATASILRSLRELGVPRAQWAPFVTEALLALRGWAGMFHQIEQRPDRVPVEAPPATLLDFLAVRLILDQLAAAATPAETRAVAPPPSAQDQAFQLLQLAQILGLPATSIEPTMARALLTEAAAFSRMERRRLLHLAYEHNYYDRVLDALATHNRESARAPTTTHKTTFQAVFCIDEREESLRRHVEEQHPYCQTFGAAGFFGVAMYYQGAADARPQALCPVVIRPQHEIHEVVADELQTAAERRAWMRRQMGRISAETRTGSLTLGRGMLLTALGIIAVIPMVFRVLFPRLTSRLRQQAGALVRAPTRTRLLLERHHLHPPMLGQWTGYTVPEMAGIVRRLLEDIGLTSDFAPFVVITGHGSTNLNNPHEAAYNCGACGSGHGGPNARAFAQMANHPEVRALLRSEGLHIPEGVVFVGAYHNTCNDELDYFDLERLTAAQRSDFSVVQAALRLAAAANAQERCRRFLNVPRWFTPALAKSHVESRAEDIAQPRPEYGHATNAMCVVGRRSRTRDLFLDRRAFLVSYDPERDPDDHILLRILSAAIPVVVGINLEYYFSHIDPVGYGCGTKLPHNITALLGVMDGYQSDLRTGLHWQTVEIHEPMRLLVVVETTPARMERVLAQSAGLRRLVENAWFVLATLSPDANHIFVYGPHGFTPHYVRNGLLPEAPSSAHWFRGRSDHLPLARIRPT